MLLPHTNASLPLSQINRLYPVHIIFFQVLYHPDGVRRGREESSSKTIALNGGRALMPCGSVSLSLGLWPRHSHCGLCIQRHHHRHSPPQGIQSA